MTPKTSFLCLTLLTAFACASAWAQPAAASAENRKPITCKWTTVEGMRYFYSGTALEDHQSLEKVISPLHDTEANRLLNLSASSQGSGLLMLIGGTALLAGGLIILGVDPDATENSEQLDGFEIGGGIAALVGVVGDVVGVYKLSEARTAEFGAVQRYNAVVHGDDLTPTGQSRLMLKTNLLAFKF